jgi:diguanylate cyclase (GGDEF)-like protein
LAKNLGQSLRWWLLLLTLIGVGLGVSGGRSAPLRELWRAPQGPQATLEARQWLQTFEETAAQTRTGCPAVSWSGLDAGKPARAFAFEWPAEEPRSLPLVYLQDPITEKAVFITHDRQGCLWVQESGRGLEFSHRAVASPFPNVQLPGLDPQATVTVLLQDAKTIRPWIFVSSVREFQRGSTVLWMFLMAFCTVLLGTVFVAMSFGGPQQRVVLGFLLFVSALLFWLMHNFSVGAMLFDFWPGAHYFPELHAIAVAGVVFGIGFANLEFLRFQGVRRLVFQCGVALSALAFISSAWWQWGYRVGSAMLAVLALMTLLELTRQLAHSDRSFKLFALGFCATIVGGGTQALSVILGGATAGHWAIFAFPLGAFTQSVFWLAAVVTQVQSRRRERQAKLLFDATYDALTGLYNRAQITARIDTRCQTLRQTGREAAAPAGLGALLFLGLDRFKLINDSLGHSAGDELLKLVSQRLRSVCGEAALVGRFGGDEFLILTHEAASEAAVTTLSQAIVQAIAAPMVVAGRSLEMGSSMGVRMMDTQCHSMEEVLRDADTALHAAKRAGGNRVTVFHSHMREQLEARLTLERDLAQALRSRQLELFFQPIVHLKDQSHAGFEALVRWRHPASGFISPVHFVPAAEETGMIEELGRQVLELAMQAISGWKRQGLWRPGWYVSVNVSGGQLGDDSLLQHIESMQQQYGVACEDFRLELTETAVISNPAVSDRLFPLIRERGIGLCMDDFGTGYSSLSYLSDLPFNVLKIDKSFIDDVVTRKEQLALVRAVLFMSQELGLMVVAEGVEQAEQNELLATIGCGYGQGYFYAKPMPLPEATGWLQRKATD